MSGSEQTPKIRVVKKAQRQKSGVIEVADASGQVFYKGPCDRCSAIVSTRRKPLADDRLICAECRGLERVAKPSTRVIRKRDRNRYITACDLCGQEQTTFFLPKEAQDFHCDECRDTLAADARREAQRAAKRQQAAMAESAVETPAPDESPSESGAGEAATAHQSADAEQATAAELTAMSGISGDGYDEPVANAANTEAAARSDETASHVPASENETAGSQPPSEKPAATKLYKIPCKRCRQTVELPFRPERGEKIMCPSCFSQERDRQRKKEGKPNTDILFNIVCTACGKHETVNFVPSNLSEALCSQCFNRKIRRR